MLALNILNAAPDNAAASESSAPVACANRNMAPVESNISRRVKPNLANSICSSVACAAVYFVVAPN